MLTVAKRDLKAGERLDGIGGYSTYGLVENFHTARAASALPIALSENCLVIRDVPKDQALTLADVVMPPGLLVEMLWREQTGALVRHQSRCAIGAEGCVPSEPLT